MAAASQHHLGPEAVRGVVGVMHFSCLGWFRQTQLYGVGSGDYVCLHPAELFCSMLHPDQQARLARV